VDRVTKSARCSKPPFAYRGQWCIYDSSCSFLENQLGDRTHSHRGVDIPGCRSCAEPATNAPPRAARSVHLNFPAPEGDLFYNEMVVEQSVPGSYFMACGWDTGYFGLQQLDRADDKVVLFSVWDPTRGMIRMP